MKLFGDTRGDRGGLWDFHTQSEWRDKCGKLVKLLEGDHKERPPTPAPDPEPIAGKESWCRLGRVSHVWFRWRCALALWELYSSNA